MAGAGSGLVAVGGPSDYEVAGFQTLVVTAADGDQVVDIGGATVAVPFSDVVEIASVHGSAAFEASSVADGHGQSLRGIGKALLAT